jgi:Fur family ferric uptake transcriptional regulator
MNSSKPKPPHPTHRRELSALTDCLRRQARRITGPRRAILKILQERARPLSNKEILTALPRGQCNLATIYRAMHLLQKMGLVKQFDFGDGTARFELICAGRESHHHHLVCTQCSDVIEIEACGAKSFERRIAAAHGFKAVTHKLEFFGICPECQERPGKR